MAAKKSNEAVLNLSEQTLCKYLSSLYKSNVEICGIWRLGCEKSEVSKDLKGFGYGVPYFIEFRINGDTKRVVLETMHPEGFGHDHFSDRGQILLWQHSAFNKLPEHVHSVDVGAFTADGKEMKSLGDCREFFIVTELVEGKLYHLDLDRMKETGELGRLDEQRCLALSDYLASIHEMKREAPWLYVRRVRDLVGHGECIMGLLDSYPPKLEFVSESDLIGVERNCVIWRWRLKQRAHRLS